MKFSDKQTRPPSQSGQAALEYVLILVVTVALILALIMQIFQPMQKFLQSYMGDYTACLLETGELPSLGGDSSAAADQGCSAKYEKATLAKGRPAKTEKSGGGTTPESEAARKDPADKSSSSYAGSSSRSGGGGRFFASQRSTPSIDGTATQGKTTEIPVDEGGGGSFFKTRFSDGYGGGRRRDKVSSVPLSKMSEAEKKKLEKKERLTTRIVATDELGRPLKKMILKKDREKAEEMPPDTPFTIGNFMRMLFIIAIILAIVVFVGGQVLQMSKSYEK